MIKTNLSFSSHQPLQRPSQEKRFSSLILSMFYKLEQHHLNQLNPRCKQLQRRLQAQKWEHLKPWLPFSNEETNTPAHRRTWLITPSIMFAQILYFAQTYVKTFILFLLLLSNVQAGIGYDLKQFFDRAGTLHNTTKPGVYQNQSAGYYSGGGFTVRGGVRTAQIATLQMPGFKAGCGGIDAWGGGFSHIKSGELVAMLQNIGSSATSYAFMLAVQTVSPQIYNIMNELNALATKINQANINSCETAATLLGGVWPKTDQSSQHLCKAMGTNLGTFSDWAAARQGCGAKGNRGAVLSGRSGDYKDMLTGEFNLAWKAIQQNAFLRSDPELARLFLTLTGSIIVRTSGEAYNIIVLPSHADNDQVLNGLLQGGAAQLYRCDGDACLNPSLQPANIDESHALFRKVRSLLDELVRKILADEALTEEEKGFLNATRLPIYKMLNVLTAYRKGHAPIDVQQYAELIAVDILYTYVLEVMDIVYESVVQLRSVQVDEEHITKFLEQLRYARSRLIEKRTSSFEAMDQALSMIESTQLLEKQLHVMMGRLS